METLKQTAITAISKLPDNAKIEDMISLLHKIKTEQQTANQQATSCLELMKDYIGCCEGPSDLSTNKKHLEGYGT